MSKLKVLIAEDEEILRDIYEMILDSEFPCEFIKAHDGSQAIKALEEYSDIDVIISDYNMPKANGGALYVFNKSRNNVPFIFLSGGDITDYAEFSDFKEKNNLNSFFNKPFPEDKFILAVRAIFENKKELMTSSASSEVEIADNKFIKIHLSQYAKYAKSSSDVYIKLGDNKYTKILTDTENHKPDLEQVEHFLKKGIVDVFIKKEQFYQVVQDTIMLVETQIIGEKKPLETFITNGIKFDVCYDGLKDIGLTEINIESVNAVIDETVNKLLNDKSSKDLFLKYCETEGFLVGHSLLIMYIAGKICKETSFNFQTTMSRITTASFYHDFSVYELEDCIFEMKLDDISDREIYKKVLDHPVASVDLLPESGELVEETKKIILEHHERPDGSGYPRKLNASQISPMACLFILSEQISLCLLRNNFEPERLKDFLHSTESLYSKGNFEKVYKAAKTCFA